jgi:hypothetical protein
MSKEVVSLEGRVGVPSCFLRKHILQPEEKNGKYRITMIGCAA